MPQFLVVKVNPNILKWAREQCGLTYQQAVGSYLNAEKLKNVENGKEFLTFNQLVNLSRKYGRNSAFFYLEKIPEEDLLEDFRTLDSSTIRFNPKLIRMIYSIKDKRELCVEFQDYDQKYDYSYVNSISLTDNIITTAEKINKLLNINFKIRQKWKDKYSALKGWKKKIEDNGVLIFELSRIEISEMRAFSISETPYPVIGLNRGDQVFGRIFSLIHEFCHIMLKKGGICTYAKNDEEYFEIERFCNAVTGEVLVPTAILNSHKIVKNRSSLEEWDESDIRVLSKLFWVSSEVIVRRLSDSNLITKRFYQRFVNMLRSRPLPRRSGGGEKGYELVLRKNSPNFIKIVLNALNEKKVLLTDTSYYLNTKLKHLNNIKNNFRKLYG